MTDAISEINQDIALELLELSKTDFEAFKAEADNLNPEAKMQISWWFQRMMRWRKNRPFDGAIRREAFDALIELQN